VLRSPLAWEGGRLLPITDEIQRQSTARLAVAEPIEEGETPGSIFQNALASLRIGLGSAVIGQRCDDFHTMPARNSDKSAWDGRSNTDKLHRSITWRPNARLCSTSQRKLGLSSGAPPVISTVGISS